MGLRLRSGAKMEMERCQNGNGKAPKWKWKGAKAEREIPEWNGKCQNETENIRMEMEGAKV